MLSAYVLIQAEVGKVAHVARALSGLEGVQLAEDITGPYEPRDVFATLQRVVDAAWRCSQVDGASLALEHEDGLLRWVVVTDGAAELREDTQRELGEGPGLAAYAEEATVTVVDLETDRRYAGLVTVVPKLGVRGALSVPVAVGGRPVAALSVYATRRVRGRRLTSLRWAPTPGSSPSCWQPAWRLAPRDAEVAELTQALTAWVWVEQAKGH